MRYHIDTGLISDKFSEGGFCPLCEIQKIVENGICHELLGDGCMDDDVRTSVNAKGFCPKHFDLLYSMPSKLGLTLQIQTRIKFVASTLTVPKSVLSAKHMAKKLLAATKTCFVCDVTEQEMVRFYKKIADMFATNAEFRKTLAQSQGFCIEHFAKLLEHSSSAQGSSKAYIKTICDVEQKVFANDLALLQRFAERHDYRNIGKPLGEAENALHRIRSDLYGKK